MSARAGTLRRVAIALLLAAGVVIGTVVTTATAASAHAVLVSSTPASGATVATPPSTVTLTFDENVRAPAYVVVTGPNGARADDGAAQILDATVTQHLKTSVRAGSYTIAYRVVSADGHPVEDELTYTVAAGSAAAAATTTTADAAAGQGHSWHLLGGLAVVLAGVAALVYERLQRRRHPVDSGASS